ncbi:hypothetical protein NC653_017283 [Populus alba x Populus x berolinensis]|uniref:Uncharacterized protein n=1 Tax=Populus alba x Populus x berolinensis TaxID=444605 RepID=A0AAD6QQ65_9ROSI|nr:hypothetical protein NC653_017283 [Populus alba x Populus x berolinensis]
MGILPAIPSCFCWYQHCVVWFSNQPGRIFWFHSFEMELGIISSKKYIGELMFGWPTSQVYAKLGLLRSKSQHFDLKMDVFGGVNTKSTSPLLVFIPQVIASCCFLFFSLLCVKRGELEVDPRTPKAKA